MSDLGYKLGGNIMDGFSIQKFDAMQIDVKNIKMDIKQIKNGIESINIKLTQVNSTILATLEQFKKDIKGDGK